MAGLHENSRSGEEGMSQEDGDGDGDGDEDSGRNEQSHRRNLDTVSFEPQFRDSGSRSQHGYPPSAARCCRGQSLVEHFLLPVASSPQVPTSHSE